MKGFAVMLRSQWGNCNLVVMGPQQKQDPPGISAVGGPPKLSEPVGDYLRELCHFCLVGFASVGILLSMICNYPTMTLNTRGKWHHNEEMLLS